MRILLVDDNPDDLFCTSIYLKEKGHTCTTANGIEQALELYNKEKYDVVITDTNMPVYQGITTGIELMKKLRQLYPENKTPIIITSGNDYEKEALKAGAIAFWDKNDQEKNAGRLNDLLK